MIEEDDEDFRSAMGDVEPLADHKSKVERVRRSEDSLALQNRRDAALGLNRRNEDPNPLYLGEVPSVEPRACLEWKKDGVQREVFRKLATGAYPIDASLDLHGLTVKEARVAVYQLLVRAQVKQWRTILIAHGRGEASATPARIKSYVAYWMSQHPMVIAYHSALQRHGGTGACYVLIKKSAKAKAANRESYGLQGETPDEME